MIEMLSAHGLKMSFNCMGFSLNLTAVEICRELILCIAQIPSIVSSCGSDVCMKVDWNRLLSLHEGTTQSLRHCFCECRL